MASLSASSRKRKIASVRHQFLSMAGPRRNVILLILAGMLLGQFIPWPWSNRHSTSNLSMPIRDLSRSLPTRHSTAAEACRDVVDRQRAMLNAHFASAFEGVQSVALIGYPNHANKGDSAIWVAEEILLASLGINVRYVCSGMHDYQPNKIRALAAKGRFAIAFHGGGNLGDIYPEEQRLKLQVLEDFPHVPIRWFPQSIHFRDKTIDEAAPLGHFLSLMKQVQDMQIVVRDIPSLDFARRYFEPLNTKVTMTPDIVFAMGNRPDMLQTFGQPTNDLLVFRRRDAERTSWEDWAGRDLQKFFIEQMEEMGPSWNSSALAIGDWIDFDLAQNEIVGKSEYLQAAWIRFMQGARWLASGEVVLLDRLHGHILSLLMGIPHVIVDNEIGKLGNYRSTWTKDCPLALVVSDPSAGSIKQALTQQRALLAEMGR